MTTKEKQFLNKLLSLFKEFNITISSDGIYSGNESFTGYEYSLLGDDFMIEISNLEDRLKDIDEPLSERTS